jgi:hypothetical protein
VVSNEPGSTTIRALRFQDIFRTAFLTATHSFSNTFQSLSNSLSGCDQSFTLGKQTFTLCDQTFTDQDRWGLRLSALGSGRAMEPFERSEKGVMERADPSARRPACPNAFSYFIVRL